MPNIFLLLWCFSSFFKEIHKIRRGFVVCFQNLAYEKQMKFWKFLDAALLILQVTDNLPILSRGKIELKKVKFISTHAE